MKRPSLTDPKHYFNRHVQWLEFNRRVLEEARDIGNPLLERVKFLAITANNLDEFVEIRVSSFLQQIEDGSREISPDGLTSEEELVKISAAMHVLVNDQYKCWNTEILPALRKENICVLSCAELDPKSAKAMKTFYDRRVYPMLTPVTVDPTHPSTARFYSDLSLLTSDPEITAAAHDVFNYLTAYAEQPSYKPLLVAPRDLAKSCIALIDREARHAKRGKPARMIIKMNAVVDPAIVQALYRASQAGVEVDLIVRGQCVLVPGVRGLSSRIRVRSIVGRFLEHSRIFYFENAGNPEIYLGSADWMPRNLYARVEVVFPVKDPYLCERICTEILSAYLADTRKARILGSDGEYSRPRSIRNGHGFSAQEHLMRVASANGDSPRTPALAKPSVVYTAADVKPDPVVTPSDDSDTQETTNAAV